MRSLLLLLATLLALPALACDGSSGEVLVVVDTDLPLALGNRLRIDLFRPDGTWYATRDYPITDIAGWPASFGVVSDDPVNTTSVFARLRVYAEGQTRDYIGERFHDNTPPTPEFVAGSITEMCDNALELPVGAIAVGRRGQVPFTPVLSGDDCTLYGFKNRTGALAAYVDVKPGSYTFGILASAPPEYQPYALGQPPPFPFQQATLQLRRSCEDDASYIACDPGWGSPTSAPDGNPRITASFKTAERVYVIVGGIDAAAGPLEVAIGAWKTGGPVPGDEAIPAAPLAQPVAKTVSEGATPAFEPEPGAAIDRLVLLQVPPSGKVAARVTLPGVCLGKMSDLGRGAIDLASARTCIDGALAPVTPLPLDSDTSIPAPLARTFGASTPCPPPDPTSSRVCVEGGAFILGGRDEVGSSPVHTVAVSTFWIDRYETTVGDYRASGLPTDVNDGPHGLVNGQDVGCSWTPSPGKKERFPLVCLSHDRASQYCQAQGGDLPTEAQWEYAATVAGRPHKTAFSWGDDAPQCQCTGDVSPCHAPLFGRTLPGMPHLPCWSLPNSLEPVDSREDPTTGDVTPLGIVGMTGSVMEWMRDSGQGFASQCWYATPVVDPVCNEDNALVRSVRGDGWTTLGESLALRQGNPPREPDTGLGLRCVYPQ